MKPEDTFTRRLCGNQTETSFAIKTRFTEVNHSSIGFRLESKSGEGEKITQLMSAEAIAHFTVVDHPLPDTKLARHFQDKHSKQPGDGSQAEADGSLREHVAEAVEALFVWLRKNEGTGATGQFKLEDLHELLESDPPDLEPEMFGYESIFEQVHDCSMHITRTHAHTCMQARARPLLNPDIHVTICSPTEVTAVTDL